MQDNNIPECNLFYIWSKQFHSFFGQPKNSKSITVINILADNIFKYQIMVKDKAISPIIVSAPYVVNLSTDSQYHDTEFKGLLIDLNVPICSIGNIDELKALQQHDTPVSLNKNIVGLAYFIFGIGSATSIRLVNLNIILE